jgi:hypothetical protein
VKSRDQVESRLRKLRTRYAHKHVEASQKRCYSNCVHNQVHTPKKLDYGHSLETEFERAPRLQHTLLVLQDDQSVHICMYGAETPKTWPGDTCDAMDDKAKSCPMFKPRVSLDQARKEFEDKLADDEYVFNNFRDVATLQWVLGQRVHEIPLTLLDRFFFWLKKKFWKSEPALPQLPPAELPEGLWYDQESHDTAPASRP